VHRQIFEGDETIDYAFMGQNPDATDNRWLREAYENRIPVIYFFGIAPGRYQAMLPTFITGWDAKALKARVAFGMPDQETLVPPESALERRYALRAVKQRLHQASFREAVITAYNGRCALSGLPEPLLLDAAHIVADADEKLGQPVVPNGIQLSKIHHAAFDAHLIGIDPDYRLHVSERLLGQKDGPMLEALKGLKGGIIHLPSRAKDTPDRDRLALRFERFKAVA
jgi:putative restriction endonuclease